MKINSFTIRFIKIFLKIILMNSVLVRDFPVQIKSQKFHHFSDPVKALFGGNPTLCALFHYSVELTILHFFSRSRKIDDKTLFARNCQIDSDTFMSESFFPINFFMKFES